MKLRSKMTSSTDKYAHIIREKAQKTVRKEAVYAQM